MEESGKMRANKAGLALPKKVEEIRRALEEDPAYAGLQGLLAFDYPLQSQTTMGVGGSAALYACPKKSSDLTLLQQIIQRWDLPWLVLGAGTNVIFSDLGLEALCLDMGTGWKGLSVEPASSEGEGRFRLTARAGERMSALAAFAASRGLGGLAFACGIPGSVGGGTFMNAGAYGPSLGDFVEKVKVFDLLQGETLTLTQAEMDFSYRHSFLQNQPELLVLSVDFLLEKASNPKAVYAEMTDYQLRRMEAQPMQEASSGSAFKRPEGYFAGKLISDVGLKGYTKGKMAVSPIHAGFIVNLGTESSQEVSNFFWEVHEKVLTATGVSLVPEPLFLGERGGFSQDLMDFLDQVKEEGAPAAPAPKLAPEPASASASSGVPVKEKGEDPRKEV